MNPAVEAFPRRSARTRRFTLGRPRDLEVSPDGERVVFLRSSHGEDAVNALWVLDVPTGSERLVADPSDLLGDGDGTLPPDERRRRERAREVAVGIVAYATDRDVRVAAFALAGRLFRADLVAARVAELPAAGAVFDPRPDPAGDRVAYVSGGRLHVTGIGEVAGEDARDVAWGQAEFVAAEEMGRSRGFWWGPDGGRLAVARVDTGPVDRWWIADLAQPGRRPAEVAYPAAGTANAEVTLWVVDLRGEALRVDWDRSAFPYLARVRWGTGPLTLLVQTRDQRVTQVLTADPDSGATTVVREDRDAAWVDLVDGSPAWLPDGRLVTTVDRDDTRRLAIDGEPSTPPGLQVRRIGSVDDDGVLFLASREPTELHAWRLPADGSPPVALTAATGVHGAVAGGGTVVLSSAVTETADVTVRVVRDGREVATVASRAADPGFVPDVRFLELGERRLRAALLLPWRGDGPWPVLLAPYGGPHHLEVVRAGGAFLAARWFAEHGFAVLTVDGRGTPGRGAAWDRSIHLDLAGPVLDDQVDALAAAGEVEPRLDLGRVGIRGWSFGGYLAALAVLRRPDVFQAAVAGAPVTDWRLYDTHYTERYLGLPAQEPDAYARSSLLADAARLERPLLVVHGLADDNVVAAHSLRLSEALVAAGRPHTFLPLAGVTHMTPQEVVAENLLRLQLDFLRGALSGPPGRSSTSVHRRD